MKRIGIFDHESSLVGGGQHVVARMAACLARDHEVEIIHSGRGYTLAELASAFDLDLTNVRERVAADGLTDFDVPGSGSTFRGLSTGFRRDRSLTDPYDLFIYSGHRTPPYCRPGRGLVYCHFPFHARPSVQLEDHQGWKGKGPANRWARMRLYEHVWRMRLRGYPILLANSRFSARWVERRWGREAHVVHPPVVGEVGGGSRADLIVSLGRFVANDHKNLRAQLRALPELLRHSGDRWSLCMIGFCSAFDHDRRFLESLEEAARGLPVRFLVNAERSDMLAVLRQAKLFWHTAGLSIDGRETPPHLQEHFGIATAEAMRAGCVPIVPNAGGQPEIVRHGESGFLCDGLEDLVRFSVALAHDEPLRERLSGQAIRRSLDFSPDVFDEQIRHWVSRALSGARDRRREVAGRRVPADDEQITAPAVAISERVIESPATEVRTSTAFGDRPASNLDQLREVLAELVKYRGLFYQLTRRDIKIRYKQAVMGFGWAIFLPAVIVLAGLVVRFAMATLAGTPIETKTIAGIAVKAIPWGFLVGSLNFAVPSLTGNLTLVTKIYFPREVLPLSSVAAQGWDTAIGAVSVLAVLPLLGTMPNLQWLWIPLLVVLLVLFVAGSALFLSCANLFFRDVKYIVQILLTFGIFFTPVFIEPVMFGEVGGKLMLLNPLSPLLEGFRLAIVEGHNLAHPFLETASQTTLLAWSPWYLAYSAVWAVGGLLGVAVMFHRLEFLFAEYV